MITVPQRVTRAVQKSLGCLHCPLSLPIALGVVGTACSAYSWGSEVIAGILGSIISSNHFWDAMSSKNSLNGLNYRCSAAKFDDFWIA